MKIYKEINLQKKRENNGDKENQLNLEPIKWKITVI